jgi:hypothetical protein
VKALLPGLLLLAGCIDFDAIEREACTERGICDLVCRPCADHAACGAPDNLCVPVIGGGVCAMSCAGNDGHCGPGQACTYIEAGDRSGYVCRPSRGWVCDGLRAAW